jgi:protoporphyrinogen/coproporphyrinogen III oxidase
MNRGPDPAGARRHVVVIGAGIAGVAAAYRILQTSGDVDVTVLEGSTEIGGKLRLGEIAGIQTDLGAETMLNRRPEATALARSVGLEESIVYPATTTARLWTRGRLAELPRGLMGVPADLRAAARGGALSRRGALRASAERLLPARALVDDVAVGRIVAQRLGAEVRDRLVEPMLGGVYAGHADELSLQATVPQLAAGYAEHGGLRAASAAAVAASSADSQPPVFAGVRGGVGRLAVETGRAVSRLGGVLRTDSMVRELHPHQRGWRVVVGDTRRPDTIDADAVVVAIPAVPAARLLRAAVPEAARELAQIEYASMAIVTLAVPSSSLSPEMSGPGRPESSGFLVPPTEGRTIKASTFSSHKWGWLAGDTFVLRCSIGRHREEATLQREDVELVDLAMADLHDAVGLRGPLLDASVTRWGGGLPQYAVGHLARVARIREAVAALPGLAVCGAAYDGVGIPAVIASVDLAATQVVEHLARRGTMAP